MINCPNGTEMSSPQKSQKQKITKKKQFNSIRDFKSRKLQINRPNGQTCVYFDRDNWERVFNAN